MYIVTEETVVIEDDDSTVDNVLSLASTVEMAPRSACGEDVAEM